MELDYNKLRPDERTVYDLLGEDNALRIMTSAFRNACIKAEILGIKSGDPRFNLLQLSYRRAVFGIFAEHVRTLENPGEFIFEALSDDEMRRVELERTPEENSELLRRLTKCKNQKGR